jgi:hypothetical protein
MVPARDGGGSGKAELASLDHKVEKKPVKLPPLPEETIMDRMRRYAEQTKGAQRAIAEVCQEVHASDEDEERPVDGKQARREIVLRAWDCDMCPRKHLAHAVVNIGDRKYPKYRCKGCHNSARSLNRAVESKSAKTQDPSHRP